jgi:hypothetical protein
MEPHDYHDGPIQKFLRFIRNVAWMKGYIRRGITIGLKGHSARAG